MNHGPQAIQLIQIVEHRGYYTSRDIEALKMLASRRVSAEVSANLLLNDFISQRDPRPSAQRFVHVMQAMDRYRRPPYGY